MPAPIEGLLATLPNEGDGWTQDRRDKFVKTFEAVLDFCFPIVSTALVPTDDAHGGGQPTEIGSRSARREVPETKTGDPRAAHPVTHFQRGARAFGTGRRSKQPFRTRPLWKQLLCYPATCRIATIVAEGKTMPERVRERDLVIPALRAAAANGGEITTTQLIDVLTDEFEPSGTDAEILEGRSDTYFSQKVRNLISHRENRNKPVHDGVCGISRPERGHPHHRCGRSVPGSGSRVAGLIAGLRTTCISVPSRRILIPDEPRIGGRPRPLLRSAPAG